MLYFIIQILKSTVFTFKGIAIETLHLENLNSLFHQYLIPFELNFDQLLRYLLLHQINI